MKGIFVSALCLFATSALAGNRFHGRDGPSIPAAELQAALAGLAAMSRSLWLETLVVDKDTIKDIGADIVNEIAVEANALSMYNQTARLLEPVEDPLTGRELFSGVGGWEQQTSAFLTELNAASELFRRAEIGDEITNNLSAFKTSTIDFCDVVKLVIPDYTEFVEKAVEELGYAFDQAIGAIKGSSAFKGGSRTIRLDLRH